ncbi:energy transducer TonB [Roseateles puraquae]|uniref:Protein TolA n=1 Tax=Roseateles puraquae TaxID=431059 RepID=A0A254N2W0_9BURK|nr:energy transducer TonB [Roseateles puraquae]MDG0857250.1 TonB C-terminal domain-containing protein [Roseateles puraquae]OWR02499.1 protein TolA [Roseateles puraquae]
MAVATLRPPEAAGMGRGIALALLAHGLLVLALTYGLHWRSDNSAAFEAELWSAVPQVAAPREEAPPEPEPEPPRPDPRAAQQRAEQEAAEQQQRDAEIALAKEKKRKEEKAREEAARLEREKAAKEKEAKDKALKEKAEKEKAEKDKAKEEQERKKALDAKAAKEAKEAKDAEARREALRQENLRRIQGMAGGTPGSTGTAAQNSAPSAGYAGRIKGKIRPLIIYADDGGANPTAEVQVTLGPDGRILGTKVLKASADADWDRAVLRAIEKAETLPRDVDGRVPPVLILTFRPRE